MAWKLLVFPKTTLGPGKSHMSTIVFPAPQPWKKLYMAALFEEDREQLARRISQARSAAIKRSRELFQQDPRECNEERNALNNALRFLDLIEATSRKNARTAAA